MTDVEIEIVNPIKATNCVQATPDCASLFMFAQVSGAPDAENVRRHGHYEIMQLLRA
jgi:hypothetical protein